MVQGRIVEELVFIRHFDIDELLNEFLSSNNKRNVFNVIFQTRESEKIQDNTVCHD